MCEAPVLLLYALTIFIGATLLFLVQPMFARMALPLLGGSPGVWTTAVLFYQAALLAGYAYAHLAARRLAVRPGVLLHAALLLAVLAALPIAIPPGAHPPADRTPVWWFLGLLARTVGPSFFAVSATTPLLQAWFARTTHRLAADPYPLYAASNAGSVLALLVYPLLIEPALGLQAQSRLWAGGYLALLLLVLACGAVVWRAAPGAESNVLRAEPVTPGLQPSALNSQSSTLSAWRRARWLLLAFVPSSLMLSVTAYMVTNIAPIPLLWTLPLALYLLTFILTFGGEVFPHTGMVRALPVVLLPLAALIAAQVTSPLELLLPLHLLVFFVAAMVCHGALARDRPPPHQLTEFYLWLAAGGALGGLLNAIVAPLLFDTVLEYPIVLALACMVNTEGRTLNTEREAAEMPPTTGDAVLGSSQQRPKAGTASAGRGFSLQRSAFSLSDLVLPAGLGLLTAALVLGVGRAGLGAAPAGLALAFGVPAGLCFLFARRPLRLGLGVAAIFLASGLYVSDQGRLLHAERSFFGVHRVLLAPSGDFHVLAHGPTLHGMQSLDPQRRLTPLSYYAPGGPAGQLFAHLGPSRRRVAVVGLGVGSLACYRRPGQAWTFYEIDPAVERIARDARFFTFLRDCGADMPVVLGDARLMLAGAPDGAYDLIVLDAYTSDAVPVHLITREALALYLRKLAPGGVLAFHISNQFFDLRPLLAGLAQDAGLAALAQDDVVVSAEEAARGRRASQWALLARAPKDLGALADDPRWYALEAPPGAPVWTDDRSSALPLLKVR
ncbi:MAG TPA: fused MFS/spermidine synthase [Roseiflexaceae bacterium]|nr:fused MFS/spermidine synthase [Roseiflexaceae bacterium]